MARRILVVDDESEVLDAVALVLGLNGYEVVSARDGTECLSLLDREAVDLVLLDIMMPEKDGWEVLRELKQRDPARTPPVIILTAKAESIDKMLGLRVFGVQDYVTKPFAKQDLLDRVAKALDRSDAGGIQ